MNIIDIIILIFLAVGLVLGLKDGAIRQVGTLAGIIVAIFLAKGFGSTVASILGITGQYANIWGYAIVLIASLIVVGLVAKLLRKIVSAVGLGAIDRLAGGVLSLFKYALILSVLFSLFDLVNKPMNIVSEKTIASSKLYTPVVSTSSYILPAIDYLSDQIPEIETHGESK